MRKIGAANLKSLVRLWGEASRPGPGVERTVSEILRDVERRGDRALLEWTERLDGVRLTPDRLRVGKAEIRAAYRHVDAVLLEALRESMLRIERFAAFTLPRPFESGAGSGLRTGLRVVPVESAGLYAPGGQASYPSTVLMTALPARVAGVGRRALATPPGPRGRLSALVLVAAHEAGVGEIYRVGGVQAIAALAFGTASIRPVALIAGPGNIYVNEAKRQLIGRVGIDSLAGPSELVVLADDSADPSTVVKRLMAQAEHDARARVALVSTSSTLLRAVDAAVGRELPRAPRRRILGTSLANGLLVQATFLAQAVRAVNEIAPEHLELHVREPHRVLEGIRTAGAAFLGARTPTALGDYGAGPNHTLPTGRTARFASGLSAAQFVRTMATLEAEEAGDPDFFAGAARLARAEGLHNHANTLSEDRPTPPRRRRGKA